MPTEFFDSLVNTVQSTSMYDGFVNCVHANAFSAHCFHQQVTGTETRSMHVLALEGKTTPSWSKAAFIEAHIEKFGKYGTWGPAKSVPRPS